MMVSPLFLVPANTPPPSDRAVFPEMMELSILVVPLKSVNIHTPPPRGALFPDIVELSILVVPLKLCTATPPPDEDIFPEMVEFEMMVSPLLSVLAYTPPPYIFLPPLVELSEMVEFSILVMPESVLVNTPPPCSVAVLVVMVQLLIFRFSRL